MPEYFNIFYYGGAIISFYFGRKYGKKILPDEPYMVGYLFVSVFILLACLITYFLNSYFGN